MATPDHDLINAHVKRYYLFDGRVVVHESDSFSREIIDAWYETACDSAANWPAGQPYICIHYLQKLTMTTYLRDRAQALAANFPNSTGYSLVVVPDPLTRKIMELFIATFPSRVQPGITRKVFAGFEDAVAFAQQVIEQRT
jgi:hypothetical protein